MHWSAATGMNKMRPVVYIGLGILEYHMYCPRQLEYLVEQY